MLNKLDLTSYGVEKNIIGKTMFMSNLLVHLIASVNFGDVFDNLVYSNLEQARAKGNSLS